jgi:hypothetical protein
MRCPRQIPVSVENRQDFYCRGCKPKPPNIPSAQVEPGHDRIQVDELPGAAERVVPVQMDVTPRRRRDFLDDGEGFRIAILLHLASSRDRMAKLALLTPCMSPVIVVGKMSDVLWYQMSNT